MEIPIPARAKRSDAMPRSDYHAPTAQTSPAMDPQYRDRALDAWETRRANQFRQAIRQLSSPDQGTRTLAANCFSDYLVLVLPESVTALPRGYSVQLNAIHERALFFGTQPIGASVLDPEPSANLAKQLLADVRTEWLSEVSELIHEKSFRYAYLRTCR